MGDGVLFFLRAAVAVGNERGTDLVQRAEVFHGVPAVVGEIAVSADVFHGKSVGNNHAVGGEFFEDWLVVLLPGLAVIGALAGLDLNEIIANERERTRRRGRRESDDQVA